MKSEHIADTITVSSICLMIVLLFSLLTSCVKYKTCIEKTPDVNICQKNF